MKMAATQRMMALHILQCSVVGHLIIAPSLALIMLQGLSPFIILGISLPVVAGVCMAALPFIKGGSMGLGQVNARPHQAVP